MLAEWLDSSKTRQSRLVFILFESHLKACCTRVSQQCEALVLVLVQMQLAELRHVVFLLHLYYTTVL